VLERRHAADAVRQEREGRFEATAWLRLVLAEVDDHVANVDRPEPRDGRRLGERVQRVDVGGIAGRKDARVPVHERTPVRGRAEQPEGLEVHGAQLVHRQDDGGLGPGPGGEPPVAGLRAQ
jgi:hypothetical protein